MTNSLEEVFQNIQKESSEYRDKLIVLSNEEYFGYIKYFDKIVPSFGRLSVVPDYYDSVERIFLSNKPKPKYLRIFQYRSKLVVAEQQKIDTVPIYRDIQLKFLINYVKNQEEILKSGSVIHIIQAKDMIRNQDGYYPQNYPKYSIFNFQIDDSVKEYEKVDKFDKPGLYIFDKKKLLYTQDTKEKIKKPIIRQ